MAEPRRPVAVWLVLLAAGGIFAVTMGARQSTSLFLGALNTSTGLGLATISLAFAVGQICWGLTQPIGGMAADRWGSARVVTVGLLLVALGTVLIPFAHSTVALILAIGVLAAGGAGLAGPSVLMGAMGRLVPAEKRGMASGLVNAGGSFGQFVFVPIAQGLTAVAGWVTALQSLGVLVLLALPAAWVLRGRPDAPAGATAGDPGASETARQAIARAFRTPSFLLLGAGFFVCGFHVAFVVTHLPGVVASCGLSAATGAWALALIGLFNIAGSLAAGWAVGRWRMKSILAATYAARALGIAVFLLAPKTETTVLLFAAFLGFTFLSTVPPTVGLVGKLFGARRVATLFGFVMLSHQIGGFLGAWLGGVLFAAQGVYDSVWMIDIALAVGAALIHLPIREAPLPPRVAMTASPA